MFKKLLLGLWVTSLLAFAGLTAFNSTYAVWETFGGEWFGSTADAGIAWVSGDGSSTWGGLIGVVKSFINWMLGLLSLIALVMLLMGGFKMVTAAGDEEKYKGGFTIMKQAWIWLAVIGLSWFVVSIIFWVIGSSSGGSVGWA